MAGAPVDDCGEIVDGHLLLSRTCIREIELDVAEGPHVQRGRLVKGSPAISGAGNLGTLVRLLHRPAPVLADAVSRSHDDQIGLTDAQNDAGLVGGRGIGQGCVQHVGRPVEYRHVARRGHVVRSPNRNSDRSPKYPPLDGSD